MQYAAHRVVCHRKENGAAHAERRGAEIGPTRARVLAHAAMNEAKLYDKEQDFLVNKGLQSSQSCADGAKCSA